MSVETDVSDGILTTGNFTIQATMPNGKTLIMSGYIYSHNNKEDISKQIDIYHDVIDRQRARAEVPELEVKVATRVKNLEQIKDHIENLKTKRDSGRKLSAAELKQIDDLMVNVKVLEKDISEGMAAVEEAKLKAS
jgi:plasmid stabilization system protein ParE